MKYNTTFNATVTDTAGEILGKERRKKPWVTRNVLDLGYEIPAQAFGLEQELYVYRVFFSLKRVKKVFEEEPV